MARLTKEERAELEARLAEDDEDDESDEVTVKRADGSSFTGTFKRALQLGLVAKTEPKPAKDAKDGGEGGEVKRFTSGRRTG
jgi:hypothetical protein